MTRQSNLLALPLILTLAACGGGGGGSIASAPVPLPAASPSIVGTTNVVQGPLAAAPAWTAGTYQGIAVFRNELTGAINRAPAGSVSLAVDTAAKTYALTVSAGGVSVTSATFTTAASPSSPFAPYVGTTVKTVHRWSDGIARPGQDEVFEVTSSGFTRPQIRLPGQRVLDSYLAVSSVPGRHVSLGYWSLSEAPLNPDGSRGVTDAWSSGDFVFGDRTAPGDIPLAGTARYTVDQPDDPDASAYSTQSTVFDVDFAARTIAANYSLTINAEQFSYVLLQFPDPATHVAPLALAANATGSAPITSAGTFDIALAGSAVFHTLGAGNVPLPDQSVPLTGSISGAFFGPQASELGGTSILSNFGFSADGRLQLVDGPNYQTFTAIRSGP